VPFGPALLYVAVVAFGRQASAQASEALDKVNKNP